LLVFFGAPRQLSWGRATIKSVYTEAKENAMTDYAMTRPDEGMHKGAVEDDSLHPGIKLRPQHGSFTGQLGHRDQDEMLKDGDTDFPGLDAEAEHTGK
jgi:hypothetical protein